MPLVVFGLSSTGAKVWRNVTFAFRRPIYTASASSGAVVGEYWCLVGGGVVGVGIAGGEIVGGGWGGAAVGGLGAGTKHSTFSAISIQLHGRFRLVALNPRLQPMARS